MIAVTDTHALVWYLLDDPRLSTTARAIFADAVERAEPVGVPTICIVEIAYLTEKGRVPKAAFSKLKHELETPGSVLVLIPLDGPIALGVQVIDRSSVPDMPDRIIAATASHFGLPLLSRDRKIAVSGIKTLW